MILADPDQDKILFIIGDLKEIQALVRRLKMTLRCPKILIVSTFLSLFIPVVSADEALPYTIDDEGKVDMYTRVGWKVFHLNCYSCHGVDAVGTDVAPSLVEALKDMTKNEFITKVLTRYRITMGSGQVTGDDVTALREAMMAEVMKYERSEKGEIIMPAWSQSPYVQPHVEDLYAYLKARSDGALKPGEPVTFDP